MKTDLDGLLLGAAGDLDGPDGSGGGRAAALRTLAANLRELSDRTEAGDLAALDEFFGLYVFEGRGVYARPRCEGEPVHAERVETPHEASPEGSPSGPVALAALQGKVERLSALLREGLQLDRPLGAPALPRTLADAEDLRRRALAEVTDAG